MKLLCQRQFLHKSLNILFVLVTIKDKLTDLRGNGLLQNDLINTLCEIRSVNSRGTLTPFAPRGERVFYWQPTGPDPPHHVSDVFGGPASRHVSLNSLFQVPLYLPFTWCAGRVRVLTRSPKALLTTEYRGTSLIRNNPPVGPYSRPMPGALWWC